MLLESILTSLNKTFTPDEFEELLIYFSSSIIRNLTEEELAWDLVKNCISKLHFEDCVIYLIDEPSGDLKQVAAHGPKNPRTYEIFNPITIKPGEGITGTVAITGVAEIVPDTRKDPRYIVDDQPRLSELAVPLKNEDRVIGVIDCEHSSAGFFTEGHMQILSAIAAICGIKIAQIRADRERQEKEQLLLKAEEEMLRAKIMAIRAQMNPHFIFNALNSIQHFVTSDDKRLALKYISHFGKLVRFYLKHLESENITLADEINMLITFLELQQMRYGDKISYKIDKKVERDDVAIPAYILHSLVENIIEYLMDRHRAECALHLKIRNSSTYVEIVLKYIFSTDRTEVCPIRESSEFIQWEEFLKTMIQLRHLQAIYEHLPEVLIEDSRYRGKFKLVLPLG